MSSTLTITDLIRSGTPTVVTVALLGPPGTSAESQPLRVTRTAGMDLGGHRIVRLNADGEAIYADQTTASDASVVLGMTISAADEDDEVTIQTEGQLIEPSWDWDPDLPIFLSTAGQLTQIEPATGFVLQVAIPTGTDRAFIRIGEPIVR